MSLSKKNVLLLILGIVPLFIVAATLKSYPGNAFFYIAFTTAFSMLLVSMFHQQQSYVYTYLSGLLWLGCWLKTVVHFIYSLSYVEPTGEFDGSAEAWDEVLLVMAAGAIGIVISRAIFLQLSGGGGIILSALRDISCWRGAYNKWSLILFLLVLLATAFANTYFGIFVAGFTTKTILIYPLNALITLMLVGGGFVVWAASILWWRLISKQSIFLFLIFLIFSGAIITLSTLSRGMIVSFVLPLLYAFYINRQKAVDYQSFKFVLIGLLFVGTVYSCFSIVNTIRNFMYFDKGQPFQVELLKKEFVSEAPNVKRFLAFSVDRWIGVEGVMAVSSYPEIGMNLFVQTILEKPDLIHPSIYEEIAPWPQLPQSSALRENVRLMSVSGGIAFLYYSGAVTVVFVSTILIGLFLQCAEAAIMGLTSNPILCSGVGWILAQLFVHFGGAPRFMIPVFVFLIIAILLAAVFQKCMLRLCSRPITLDGRKNEA